MIPNFVAHKNSMKSAFEMINLISTVKIICFLLLSTFNINHESCFMMVRDDDDDDDDVCCFKFNFMFIIIMMNILDVGYCILDDESSK